VRARAARRQQRNVLGAGAAAAAILLVLTASHTFVTHTTPETPATPFDAARFDRAAEAHMHVIAALKRRAEQQAEQDRLQVRLAGLQALADTPDPIAETRRQVEQAAYALLQHADRLEYDLHQREPARRSLQNIVQLFPDSPWAAVARARLAKLNSPRGDTL
jgi:hypothetical protein